MRNRTSMRRRPFNTLPKQSEKQDFCDISIPVAKVDSTSAYCAGGLPIESRHPTSAIYVACRECDWLPCWLPRGQQVSHQRWISVICCVQARKHTSEGSTLALKPRGDITRSPKQGYQWPHKKDSCPPKNILKKKIYSSTMLLFFNSLSLSVNKALNVSISFEINSILSPS